MPGRTHAGDLLAGRYRLTDLLSEARGGRFWRAWDTVLSRHVAVHLIAEDDARAEPLMEAARRSATLFDPHLLRVLDADNADGYVFVVNEWGEGISLDRMLADQPLAPRRAAWLVAELGSMIAVAHDAGIAHGRLVPENVLLDETGSVKVIGFAVDAALNGVPDGRISGDVVDLAAVLYAALTGRWPGISRSAVPSAPQEGGKPLRPRQVRAGVPRSLDTLCDEVLNPYPNGTDHGYDSARAIVAALEEYVGDLAAVAEAEAREQRGNTSPRIPRIDAPLVLAPEISPGAAAAASAEAVADATPDADAETGAEPAGPDEGTQAMPALAAAALAEGPATDDDGSDGATDDSSDHTQAAVPVFDDRSEEERFADDWHSPRSEPAPPPPPFEEPPERPLFAPDPPEGRAARVPRNPGADTGTQGSGYWPWEQEAGAAAPPPPPDEDDEDDDDRVPGRSWLRIGAVLLLALLVALATLYAFNRGRDGGSGDDEPTAEPSTSQSPSRSAAPEPLTVASAADFDPFGDPPEENPELAPNAIDGDPGTSWSSLRYNQNFGPGGLKPGVGLLLDLGEEQEVGSVRLTLAGSPTTVRLLGTTDEAAPTGIDGLDELAEGTADGTDLTLEPEQATNARWLVVWLTSVPNVGGGFRGEVAEVVVRP